MDLLSSVVARFLDHCRVGRSLSANTLRAYQSDLTDYQLFAGEDARIGEIGRDDVRNYVRALFDGGALKEASIKRRVATLKAMFHWLERETTVEVSPFHRLDLVVRLPRRLPRAISPDELRRLLAAVETSRGPRITAIGFRLAILTLFTTGLRIGELTNIHLGDLDPVEGVIQVRGKGDRERRVYLVGEETRTLLDAYLQERKTLKPEHDLLFVSRNGSPISAQHIRRRLRSAGRKAELSRRVTPHMLRHTAATQLIEAGVDIRFVQKLLGHASIATTQIYTHVSDSKLKETVMRADTLGRLSMVRA